MKNKALAIIIGIVAIVSACGTKKNYQYTEGKIYGTFYHITYNFPDDLQKDLRAEMEKVNASLSMFNPQSVISKINRGESDSTDLLFREMFVKAEQVNRETKGAFDITVAPLVNAWGFGFKTDSFPSAGKIDSILQFVGMDKLALQGDRLVKQVEGMEIDASSIAKGLGTDLVADYLDRKGVTDYMVEIGGEIRAKGMSRKGRPWRIGLISRSTMPPELCGKSIWWWNLLPVLWPLPEITGIIIFTMGKNMPIRSIPLRGIRCSRIFLVHQYILTAV